MEIENLLREYFISSIGVTTLPANHELLAEHGFVASAQLLELVDFIEERFGVVLQPIDVLPENLASITTIAQTVRLRIDNP
jgi:acyl carrier protein